MYLAETQRLGKVQTLSSPAHARVTAGRVPRVTPGGQEGSGGLEAASIDAP